MLNRKLSLSFLSQVYGQATNIVLQLGSVPVLLHYWGYGTYAAWLVISAIPTYLMFSDFGLTFIAKNEMVMAVAGNDRNRAVEVYNSVFLILCLILPLIALIGAAAIFGFDWRSALGVRGVRADDANLAMMALVLQVAAYQLFLLGCAGIRSENRPALEASVAATARAIEGLAVMAAAFAGKGLAVAAGAMLAVRVAFVIGTQVWLRFASPWLRLGWRQATRETITTMFRPSLSYMLLPISQASLLQAPVVVLSAISTPAAVVIFSTTRTLTRLGTAFTNMLNNALVTEYSVRHAHADAPGWSVLKRRHLQLTIAGGLAYMAGISVLGDWLMKLFTHGRFGAVFPFFYLMALAVVLEMVWSTLFTPISAINRHRAVVARILLYSLAGIGGCYVLGRALGLTGIGLCLVAAHVLIVASCIRHSIANVQGDGEPRSQPKMQEDKDLPGTMALATGEQAQ